jgi:hypothetical protein
MVSTKRLRKSARPRRNKALGASTKRQRTVNSMRPKTNRQMPQTCPYTALFNADEMGL